MPAWIIVGAPTRTAVVAAANRPAHRRRMRPVVSAPSVDRKRCDTGEDDRCRDSSRSRHTGQQPDPQKANTSRHLMLLSRGPSATAAPSVQRPTADGTRRARIRMLTCHALAGADRYVVAGAGTMRP
jgi:hypothetical protein